MKRIRRRLRKVRTKLARILRLLEAAHRETHRQWKKARHAADVGDKAERQGRTADARKAERRRLYHANKGRRWERRTDWLAGKRRHLTKAQEHWLDKKEKWLHAHPPPKPTGGWATFDGKSVPNWMVPWLEKSRRAGWGGVVVSGIRTPEYSEQLCLNMCGAVRLPLLWHLRRQGVQPQLHFRVSLSDRSPGRKRLLQLPEHPVPDRVTASQQPAL